MKLTKFIGMTAGAFVLSNSTCTKPIETGDDVTPDTTKVVNTARGNTADVFNDTNADTDAEWESFLKDKSKQNQQANTQSKSKHPQENANNRTTEVTGDTTRINDAVNSQDIQWSKINTKRINIGGRRIFVEELEKLGKNVKIIITDSKEYTSWSDIIKFCIDHGIQIMTPSEHKRMLTESMISTTLQENTRKDHEAALANTLSENGRGGETKLEDGHIVYQKNEIPGSYISQHNQKTQKGYKQKIYQKKMPA